MLEKMKNTTIPIRNKCQNSFVLKGKFRAIIFFKIKLS